MQNLFRSSNILTAAALNKIFQRLKIGMCLIYVNVILENLKCLQLPVFKADWQSNNVNQHHYGQIMWAYIVIFK